uniref:Uncharacterized protein n=1 Tax=Pipistrellus kuhlii TaxID=59472 RepID=A0A7J7QT14_PIPKU|nr:hypothetical protein mPipKuh1_008597 [Pipistrellus kuhlii]
MSISLARGVQTPNSNERDTCPSQLEPRERTHAGLYVSGRPTCLAPERRPRCVIPAGAVASGRAGPPPSDLRAPRRSRSRAQGRPSVLCGVGGRGEGPRLAAHPHCHLQLLVTGSAPNHSQPLCFFPGDVFTCPGCCCGESCVLSWWFRLPPRWRQESTTHLCLFAPRCATRLPRLPWTMQSLTSCERTTLLLRKQCLGNEGSLRWLQNTSLFPPFLLSPLKRASAS